MVYPTRGPLFEGGGHERVFEARRPRRTCYSTERAQRRQCSLPKRVAKAVRQNRRSVGRQRSKLPGQHEALRLLEQVAPEAKVFAESAREADGPLLHLVVVTWFGA